MASDKEKDRSLNGFDRSDTNRSRDVSGVNTASRSDKEVDRSLGMDRSVTANRSAPDRSRETAGGGEASRGFDRSREMNAAQSRRAGENASMRGYDAAAANTAANASRANMTETQRALEADTMGAYDRMRQTDMAADKRASEDASMKGYYAAKDAALGTIRQAETGLTNPYNKISGGKVVGLTDMTIDEATSLAKTQWNGKIANVVGGFQFKDTTLAGIARKMGIDPATTKMTPEVQDKLALGLMQQRADDATVNGKVDVDRFAANLAKEWASLATPGGLSHYASNGVDKASVSYKNVREMAQNLVDTGVVGPRGTRNYKSLGTEADAQVASATARTGAPIGTAFASLPGSVAVPSAKPSAQEFADNYLTAPRDVVKAEYSNATTARNMAPASPVPHTAAEARAEFEEDQRIASSYESTPPTQVASAEPSAPPASAPPSSAPQPADKPATPAQRPQATDQPTETAPRSTGAQVAATGIDIASGFIPGAGTPISIVNGLLALTGNRTIGERLVDALGNPVGDGGTVIAGDFAGRGKEYKPQSEKPKAATMKATDFASTYLDGGFVDRSRRPTPEERWNYNTPGFV